MKIYNYLPFSSIFESLLALNSSLDMSDEVSSIKTHIYFYHYSYRDVFQHLSFYEQTSVRSILSYLMTPCSVKKNCGYLYALHFTIPDISLSKQCLVYDIVCQGTWGMIQKSQPSQLVRMYILFYNFYFILFYFFKYFYIFQLHPTNIL